MYLNRVCITISFENLPALRYSYAVAITIDNQLAGTAGASVKTNRRVEI
jgi:hypothetical protein